MVTKHKLNQIYSKVSYGASIGWLSPTLKVLTSQNSPLPSGSISIEGLPFTKGFIGNHQITHLMKLQNHRPLDQQVA